MVLAGHVASLAAITTMLSVLPAQLAVEGVTPKAEQVRVSPLQPIQWELSEPVSESSLNGATVKVWGRWGGAVPGAVSLRDGGYTVRFSPLEPFAPGEMVTASLAPPITGRYGGQLATTHVTSFWIAATAAQPQLAPTATVNIRLPGEGPIRSYGAYAGDIDNDGFPDLCVPNEYSDDVRYFRNDGAVFSSDTFGVGMAPDFAARFSGTLVVDTTGTYEFLIGADEGARLLIDLSVDCFSFSVLAQ